ncbi:NAD(P)H-dependent oxidoreductase [Prevotella sp.]|uniref:NAD(P)H-dependent oxidoreductase n=1 Tax=Prevotella sp. TaxID=59823 RepID=UPI002674EEC7
MKLIMSDKPLNINIQNGNDTKYFDLSSLKIANCMGCFRCWTKTPGKCVIRDDATAVYPCIAKSNKVIYVSRLKYGGYDSVMKTMLERAIPIQQAFIRIHNDETHHVQRAVTPKQATIIAYGDIDEEERDIFRNLIARNASNMSFESYNIIFTTEAMLDDMVNKVLETWDE